MSEGLAMLRQLLERTAPSEPEPERKAARFEERRCDRPDKTYLRRMARVLGRQLCR